MHYCVFPLFFPIHPALLALLPPIPLHPSSTVGTCYENLYNLLRLAAEEISVEHNIPTPSRPPPPPLPSSPAPISLPLLPLPPFFPPPPTLSLYLLSPPPLTFCSISHQTQDCPRADGTKSSSHPSLTFRGPPSRLFPWRVESSSPLATEAAAAAAAGSYRFSFIGVLSCPSVRE